MTTELTKTRFKKLCKAVKNINKVDGIVNAEFVTIDNDKAILFVKKDVVKDFYNTLEKYGIYPLILESDNSVYTLRIKLSEVDHPLFEAVEL